MSGNTNTITSGGAQGAAYVRKSKCPEKFKRVIAPQMFDAIYDFFDSVRTEYAANYIMGTAPRIDKIWNETRDKTWSRQKSAVEFRVLGENVKRREFANILNARLREKTPIASFLKEVFSTFKDPTDFLLRIQKYYANTITYEIVSYTSKYENTKAMLEKYTRIMGYNPPAILPAVKKQPAAKQPPAILPARYQRFCGRVKGAGEVFGLELYMECNRFITGVMRSAKKDAAGKTTMDINKGYATFKSNKARIFMREILKIKAVESITLKQVLELQIHLYSEGKITKEDIIDKFLTAIFGNKKALDAVKPWAKKFEVKCNWSDHPLNDGSLGAEAPAGKDRSHGGQDKSKCAKFREAAFPQSAHRAPTGDSARASKPGSPSGSHHATPPRTEKPMPPKRNVTADPARPPVHAESSKPAGVKVETGRPPKIFRPTF